MIPAPDTVSPRRRLLRLLIIEDNDADAELMVAMLKRAGYALSFDRVDLFPALQALVSRSDYDLVLSDHNLKSWMGTEALEAIRQTGKDIPFIVVTATLGDEAAVDYIKQGASDYVLKHRLERLPVAVGRALRERAHREEAARLNEEILCAKRQWELTFDTVPDAVFLLDQDRCIRRANRAAAAFLGLDFAHLIGKQWDEVLEIRGQEDYLRGLTQGVAPDVAPGLPDTAPGAVVKAGKSPARRFDVAVPRLGLVFETGATAVRDAAGALQGYVCVMRDVTVRQQAEKAVRQSEERFHALAALSPVGVFLSDSNGRCLYRNERAAQIMGQSNDEAASSSWQDTLYAADRETVAAGWLAAGRSHTLPYTVECRFQHRDGTIVWALVQIAGQRGPAGAVLGYVGTITDITASKRAEEALRTSEERYRDLFENAQDSIFTTDALGRIASVNKLFETATGCAREQAVGMNFETVVAPQHIEQVRNRIAAVFAGLADPGPHEFEIQARNGKRMPVEAKMRTIYRDGGAIGVQGIARDCTDRRKLEDQLRQAQKMEAVGRLAGGVAHDFNNLLMVIIGYSDILMDRLGTDDSCSKAAAEIRKAADRAASLTRQLLAFSRKQVLQPQELNINTVVQNIERMLRRLIGEDIELVIRLGSDLPVIHADPGQLEQVFINLAVNARDAMPEGGKLFVETGTAHLDESYTSKHAGLKPGSFVTLSVSDTGNGMDTETQEHIFEPFFTTKEPGRGTGLGLSTVYGIVKQSEGHISLYSEIGKGTTFKVYLPRAIAFQTAPAAGRAADPECEGTETILLVEDQELVRNLVRLALETHGYNVLVARDGVEALNISEQFAGNIHLLVTDVVMPRLSGRQLVQRLSAVRPRIKILYMSGYTDDVIVHHGVLDEGAPFLQKPFSSQTLLLKVRQLLKYTADAPA